MVLLKTSKTFTDSEPCENRGSQEQKVERSVSMTRNQIAFYEAQEKVRSNKASEQQKRNELAETSRSHITDETERNRTNLANEALKKEQNLITLNYNNSFLAEQNRHNLADESRKQDELTEARRHNYAQEAYNAGSLRELSRHNQAQEAHNANVLAENAYHNRVAETNEQQRNDSQAYYNQQMVATNRDSTQAKWFEASTNRYKQQSQERVDKSQIAINKTIPELNANKALESKFGAVLNASRANLTAAQIKTENATRAPKVAQAWIGVVGNTVDVVKDVAGFGMRSASSVQPNSSSPYDSFIYGGN